MGVEKQAAIQGSVGTRLEKNSTPGATALCKAKKKGG